MEIIKHMKKLILISFLFLANYSFSQQLGANQIKKDNYTIRGNASNMLQVDTNTYIPTYWYVDSLVSTISGGSTNPTSGYLPYNLSGAFQDSPISIGGGGNIRLNNDNQFTSYDGQTLLSLGNGKSVRLYNGYGEYFEDSAQLNITWNNFIGNQSVINADYTRLSIQHTDRIDIASPIIRMPQSPFWRPSTDTTNFKVLGLDASNNIVEGIMSATGGSTDTTSLSNRINLKLNKTDTLSLSTRIDSMTCFAGVWSLPTITDNGNGTVTLGSGQYVFTRLSDGSIPLKKYTIAGATYSFTDNVTNYIVANYNGGSPTITVVTSTSTINNTIVIPILTVFRLGNHLDLLNWDEAAKAPTSKLQRRIVRTQRFAVEPGGLILGEVATRNVTSTSGFVWNGLHQNTLNSFSSATSTDSLRLYSHVGGIYTKTNITAYNNTQYDDGTNLQTLSSNRYAVNWVFESVNDNQKECFIILGNGNYTLAQAQASLAPSVIPSEISSMCILIGRIIVQKSASSATEITSAFTQNFNQTPTNDHNLLSNLQGGTANEYYHLTNNEHTAVEQWSKEFIFDGQGSVIATGQYISKNVDRNVSITGWKIFEESATPVSSTIDVSLWKDTYANYPPTSADTVNYWQRPTLTAATKNQVTFSTPITATKGDEIVPYINNNNAAIRIKIILIGTIQQ